MIIRSDPQESHRVAEALRVAIGLSGGEPENIHIILMDKAPLLLYQDSYNFEDGEAIESHLEAMMEYGIGFSVEKSFFTSVNGAGETGFEVKETTSEGISQFISQSSTVLIF